MSDTNTPKVKVPQTDRLPLYNKSITITRNEVPFSPVWTNFKRGTRKETGEKFLEFPVTEDTLESVIAWYGKDNIAADLKASLAVSSQAIMDSVYEELDKLDLSVGSSEWCDKFEELYTKYMTTLTTRGETIAALKAANEKLYNDIITLGEQATDLMNKGDQAGAMALMVQMTKVRGLVSKNNEAIATKTRKKESDDDDGAGKSTVVEAVNA
jgi:hypothetical protein